MTMRILIYDILRIRNNKYMNEKPTYKYGGNINEEKNTA